MSELTIGDYKLEGGGACPEQYDVYLNGKDVGYIRLRHGVFRADLGHPGSDDHIRGIYEAYPDADGGFDDPEERIKYLTLAVNAIDRDLKRTGRYPLS